MKPTGAPTLIGFERSPATALCGSAGSLSTYFRSAGALQGTFQGQARYLGRGRSGFTLLEILLALALVSALLLLISGGFQTYLAKGKSVKNIANHRMIISALIAYAQENKGSLPRCYEDPDLSYPRRLCRDGYVTDPRIFYSPLTSDWYKEFSAWRNPQSAATIPWFYTNYAVNRYGAMPYGVYQGGRPDGSRVAANLNRVAGDGNLGKLMVLRDIYHPGYPDRGGGYVWFSGGSNLPREEKSYGGRIYASFADGHVEGFSLVEMTALMGNQDGEAPLFKDIYTK